MRTGRERSPRLALLLGIVAVHLLLILWLVSRPPAVRSGPKIGDALILIAPSSGERPASGPPKQVKQSRTKAPFPIPPPLIEMPSPEPASSQDADTSEAAAGGSGGCQLAADAGIAIQQDPAAMTELAALPPGIRTDADAVMLWNGQWLGEPEPTTAMSPPSVTGELRRVVEAIVAAAPAQCRDATAIGPVFVPIAEAGRTTMVVIGSGIWRWSQLLEEAPLPTMAPMPSTPQ